MMQFYLEKKGDAHEKNMNHLFKDMGDPGIFAIR